MNETKISDGTKFKIKGARFAAVSANIKYVNRLDLMVIYLETGSIITGVFTSSKTKAPSVLWSKIVFSTVGAASLVLISMTLPRVVLRVFA